MVLGSQKLQSTPDQNPRNPDVPDDRCRWVDIHLWSHDGWRGVVLEAGRYSAARCRWDALCLDPARRFAHLRADPKWSRVLLDRARAASGCSGRSEVSFARDGPTRLRHYDGRTGLLLGR